MTVQTCSSCNGFGHDKAARPVVKFKTVKRDDGTMGKDHITMKQGSGCMTCGGLGFTQCEKS